MPVAVDDKDAREKRLAERFAKEFDAKWVKLDVLAEKTARREKLTDNEDIAQDLREWYQGAIKGKTGSKGHADRLLDRLKVRQRVGEKEGGAPGAVGLGMAKPPGYGQPGANAEREVQWTGVVEWKGAEDFKKKLTDNNKLPPSPSTLQVRMLQEDIWVYEALIRIIEDLNSDVDEKNYEKAAVREILALDIGSDAMSHWKSWDDGPKTSAGGSAASPAPGGSATGLSPGAPAGTPSRPAAAAAPSHPAAGTGGGKTVSLTGRYVDERGRPLADGAKQPSSEFKIMPICMRLKIRQSEIPPLLTNCAQLNILVREVKIATDEAQGDRQEKADAAAPGASGIFRQVQPGGHSGLPAGGGEAAAAPEGPSCITVEVTGMIYLYNPPEIVKQAPAATLPAGPAAATGAGTPGIKPAAPSGPAAPVSKPAPAVPPAATPPARPTVPPGPPSGPPPPAVPAKGATP